MSGGLTSELPQMPTSCTLTWTRPKLAQAPQITSSDTRYALHSLQSWQFSYQHVLAAMHVLDDSGHQALAEP